MIYYYSYDPVTHETKPFEGKITDPEFAALFEPPENRFIVQEWVGNLFVSTVFLVINSAYLPDAAPVLFETMVFRGDPETEKWEPGDIYQARYSTYEQAMAGHREAVWWAAHEADTEPPDAA